MPREQDHAAWLRVLGVVQQRVRCGPTSQGAVGVHSLGQGLVHLLVEGHPHGHDGGLVLGRVQVHLSRQPRLSQAAGSTCCMGQSLEQSRQVGKQARRAGHGAAAQLGGEAHLLPKLLHNDGLAQGGGSCHMVLDPGGQEGHVIGLHPGTWG